MNKVALGLRSLATGVGRRRDCTGFLDGIEDYEVVGWAVDYAVYPAPTHVDILLDGERVGRVVANVFRTDLATAGLVGGRFGFRFDLSPYAAHGRRSQLEVRFADGRTQLSGSPRALTLIRDGRGASNISSQKVTESVERAAIRVTGSPAQTPLRQEGVLLYAVRSESGFASPTVAQTLAAFRKLGFATVVVNNFHPKTTSLDHPTSLQRHTDMLIEQESRGRDFAAWRTGLEHLGSSLRDARCVIFVNDSLTGPFQDLSHVVGQFRGSHTDLWGLTESFDRTYHIQTSFFACTPELLALPAVASHFANYEGTRRDEAVLQGELGLSQVALTAGARLGAMCDYHRLSETWLEKAALAQSELLANLHRSGKDNPADTRMLQWIQSISQAILDGVTLNPQHFFWDTLIEEFQYPYLKRELFITNPAKILSLQRLWEVLAPFDVSMVRSMLRHEMVVQGTQLALPPHQPAKPPVAIANSSSTPHDNVLQS